ncbi:unnamed protein product [Effrenium voratum]|nr:unnamed protein product [Effrenium voratum]
MRRPWLLLALLWVGSRTFSAPRHLGPLPERVTDKTLNDFAEKGDVEAALSALQKLLTGEESLQHKRYLYNTAIKACANAGDIPQAESLLNKMLEARVQPNLKGLGKMMEATAKVGNISGAEYWFRRRRHFGIEEVSTQDYNQLISAAAKAQDMTAVEKWFQELLDQGEASPVTLLAILEATARQGDLRLAQQWCDRWQSLGLELSFGHRLALLNNFAKAGDLEGAERLMAELPEKAEVAYHTVMDAASRCGNLTAAEFWFREAEAAGFNPRNEVTFSTMIFAAARAKNLSAAERWFQEAQASGLSPSSAMYTALVTAAAESLDLPAAQRWLARAQEEDLAGPELLNSAMRAAALCGDLGQAERCAEQMEQAGLALDGYSYRSLITAAARSQSTDAARRWFRQAAACGEVNLNTYNALLAALGRQRDLQEAEQVLQEMQQQNLQPDEVSYLGLVSAASDLPTAQRMLKRARDAGFGKSASLYTAVITCAAQCDLQAAEKCLEEARLHVAPDLAAYNALVAACARSGQWQRAEHWATQLRAAGKVPDLVTYTSLVSAVAKSGQVEAAKKYLEQALEQGLQPDIALMNSVISAAAKAGNVQAAQEVFDQIERAGLSPNIVTFTSLIQAAVEAEDMDRAERWLQECRARGALTAAAMAPFFARAAKRRDPVGAQQVFERMAAEGIRPDIITYSSLMSTAAKAMQPVLAEQWLQKATETSLRPNTVCYAVVMGAFGRSGDFAGCLRYLKEMAAQGLVSARELNVALRCAKGKEAEEVLQCIINWRLQPDTSSRWYLERCLGVQALQTACDQHGLDFVQAKTVAKERRRSARPQAPPGKVRKGQARVYLAKDRP